jgi:hypothetical protein
MKEYESRKEMLSDLVAPGATLAEIGVFAGDFSEWILQTLKPKKFYGVDPYTSTIGVMGSGNQDGFNMEYYQLELLCNFVKTRLNAYPGVELRREFSHGFFQSIPDGSLDAVYIDGDHSHEAVKADLEAARHAVKEGGWIFGHDYAIHPTKGNPEITHDTKVVIDAFCKEHGLTVHAVAKDGILSFAIQNTKKYSICIVSLSDRAALYSKTFQLMHSYAQKHGYALDLLTEVLVKDRHPSWSKIPAVGRVIHKKQFDYVVWMDDDIVITNPEIPLSAFIDKYNFRKSNAQILVSSDMPNEPSTVMNCGIMVFKGKHTKTEEILDTTWNLGEMNPVLKQNFSWEQEAFNFLYKFMMRDEFQIIPLPNFQAFTRFESNSDAIWKPGCFAAHLNCGPVEVKLQVFQLLDKICKFTLH